MSEPDGFAAQEDNDADLEAGDELQFDQAEFATPAPAGPSCGVCKRPIDDAYYEINGKVLCATCRQRVEAAFRGGSRLVRVFKALVFGSVGAAAGAALYYAIIRVTGLNIGLVAVVVGLMVGGAVRKGTGNRGGLFYQFLAVFLTYSAIGAMYLPSLIEASDQARLKHQQAQAVPEKVEKGRAKVAGEPKAPVIAANEPALPNAGIPPSPAPAAGAPMRDPVQKANEKIAVASNKDAVNRNRPPDPGPRQRSVARFIVLTFMLYASPLFMAYLAPISGLIYCFALWEAWKINKRAALVLNGPFRVSAGVPNDAAPEDVDDGE